MSFQFPSRRRALVTFALISAGVLSACGSDDDNSGDTGGAATGTTGNARDGGGDARTTGGSGTTSNSTTGSGTGTGGGTTGAASTTGGATNTTGSATTTTGATNTGGTTGVRPDGGPDASTTTGGSDGGSDGSRTDATVEAGTDGGSTTGATTGATTGGATTGATTGGATTGATTGGATTGATTGSTTGGATTDSTTGGATTGSTTGGATTGSTTGGGDTTGSTTGGGATTGGVIDDGGVSEAGPTCDPTAPEAGTILFWDDFESTTDAGQGWHNLFGGGTFSLSSSASHCGGHSGELSARTARFQALQHDTPLAAGTYAVSAWVMHDGPAAMTMGLQAYGPAGSCGDADANQHFYNGAFMTVQPNTWTHLTGTITVTAGCTAASVYLGQPNDVQVDAGNPDGGLQTVFPDLFIDDIYISQ